MPRRKKSHRDWSWESTMEDGKKVWRAVPKKQSAISSIFTRRLRQGSSSQSNSRSTGKKGTRRVRFQPSSANDVWRSVSSAEEHSPRPILKNIAKGNKSKRRH